MGANNRKKIVNQVKSLIKNKEDEIIPAVRQSVKSHISKKPLRDCLTIVGRSLKNDQIQAQYVPNPPRHCLCACLYCVYQKKRL